MKINNKYLKSLLISAALVSSLTACSDWFQGKIEMDMEKEAGSLATLLTPVKKVTSLDAPEQVFATEAEFYNTINVWWHEVSGATHYSIQRAVILPEPDGTYILPDTLSKWEDLDWKTIKEKVYSCTYEDKLLNQSLSSDEKYTYRYLYRVMAGNISKKLESEYSKDKIINQLNQEIEEKYNRPKHQLINDLANKKINFDQYIEQFKLYGMKYNYYKLIIEELKKKL